MEPLHLPLVGEKNHKLKAELKMILTWVGPVAGMADI